MAALSGHDEYFRYPPMSTTILYLIQDRIVYRLIQLLYSIVRLAKQLSLVECSIFIVILGYFFFFLNSLIGQRSENLFKNMTLFNNALIFRNKHTNMGLKTRNSQIVQHT